MDFTTLINESFNVEDKQSSTSDEDITPTASLEPVWEIKSVQIENPEKNPTFTTCNRNVSPVKSGYSSSPTKHLSPGLRITMSNESTISLDSIKGSTKAIFGQKKHKSRTKSKNQTLNESRMLTDPKIAPVELSVDKAEPGLLKIFGSKIKDKNSHKFITILASPSSLAKELVKEALDRYSLPERSHTEYVLCDVLGTLELFAPEEEHTTVHEIIGDHKWIERACRPLHDTDCPLALINLWKPDSGYSRRFELRMKADVFKNCVDNTTRMMNRNVKSRQKMRAKLGLQGISEELESSPPEKQEENITPTSSFSSKSRNSSQHDSYNSSSEPQETESSDDAFLKKSIAPPTDCPFLLLLRGYSLREDSIIYYLSEQITQIGSSEFTTSTNNVNERNDIVLRCPDVKSQHCWIVKKTNSADKIAENGRRLSSILDNLIVCLHPFGAMVTINGSPITKPVNLYTGDLIAVGQHYLFLYKDLTTFKDLPRDLYWLKSGTEFFSILGSSQSTSKSAMETKERHCSKLGLPCLRYLKQQQEDLLHYVTNIVRIDDPASFKLAPCYFVGCMLDFCSDVYGKAECKKLVYSAIISFNEFSLDVCEKFKFELCDWKPTRQCIFEVCELLKPVALILANALELINFLENKKSLFSPIGVPDMATAQSAQDKAKLECSEDQLLQMLDDIATEAFHESVYQLTKALSFFLPTLLNSNPFPSSYETTQNRIPSAIQSVLDLLQGVLDALLQMYVHPDVVEQLFGCLMFYTNSHLFNLLMENGSSGDYFKWSRGVQIRGNLDALESWLYQNSFQKVSNEFLGQLNAAVNLLASLKAQLMQTDWRTLRNTFPHLSPSQLKYILSHYSLDQRPFPVIWHPSEEDKHAACTEAFYESMDGAPPLDTIPLGGFVIKSNLEVPHETVLQMFTQIQAQFPTRSSIPNPSTNVFDANNIKGSWRQQRNRNTPSVTRMFSLNGGGSFSHAEREISKMTYPEEYNYIMNNSISAGASRHSTFESRNDLERRNHHHFESPAASSETLLRSSGTLKSAEFTPSKTGNLPVMGVQRKCKDVMAKQLQGDLILNSGSSGTFSGSFQNTNTNFTNSKIIENAIVDSKLANYETKIRPIPTKEFTANNAHGKRVPVIRKTNGSVPGSNSQPTKEENSVSPMSQHQCSSKTTAMKEHSDDSVSVNNDFSSYAVHSKALLNGNELQDAFRPSSSSAFVEINTTHQSLPNAQTLSLTSHHNTTMPTLPNVHQYANLENLANKTFHAIDGADNQSIGDETTMSEDREIALYMENPAEFTIDEAYTDEADADAATIQDDTMTIPDDISEVTSAAIFDEDDTDYLVMVELAKVNGSLGLTLINGYNTRLKSRGVYVRAIIDHGAAKKEGKIGVGDRIMAVDNVTISEMEYEDAIRYISNTGPVVKLVLSKCYPNFINNNVASMY